MHQQAVDLQIAQLQNRVAFTGQPWRNIKASFFASQLPLSASWTGNVQPKTKRRLLGIDIQRQQNLLRRQSDFS